MRKRVINNMSICMDLKSTTSLLKFTDDDVAAILGQYNRKPDAIDEDFSLSLNVDSSYFDSYQKLCWVSAERQIFAFLLMNKFSIEATKEKIDMMFTMRSLIPEFYQFSQKSPEMENISNAYFHYPMPNLTRNLNRLYISKCLDSSLIDGFIPVYTLMVQTMEIRNDYDICNSDEYILDMKNVSARMVTLAAPMDIKKMLTVTEKVFSNRIAAIHIVNLPTYAETIIGIFKMFLKPKIRERFYVHRDVHKLLDIYSKELLPKDYGGDGQSLVEIRDHWRKFLLDHNDHLDNMMRARVDENLRPMKLDNDELLGFHGNFRKLQVD